MKWRWRLLQSSDTAHWKEVLVAKYGDHILQDVNWSNGSSPSFVTLWWKDIRDLEVCVESRNWIVDSIDRRLGNVCISDVVENREGESRSWKLLWRRNLFQWEEESVAQLLVTIENVTLSHEEDKWWWNVSPKGCFTVKSAYDVLLREYLG
ncbi:hypothetical protein L195_g012768 [Trifolium pratense]|uniref:Uncharacterized protein n=1 Tax=Trifolium pratense TaxID=57577 RepID=A0A2K3PL98_TRIPR|nr:hypothetical protein L195_g012768 [Trifolium pratense]